MAITVKNDTSGQAIGAVGLSAGIDKNRAYRLNLDQQEIQRQQLAAQQKASEQRFQEYKDRLIREDKMNEREAEIKARTLEAAARESEANLAMQKERLDLERANSEAVAGRADANIDIQRQQLAQNSNANQMALHQQKLSYTQEAENAKIDEALRRIQSDVASGRLSPAAAKEMTRQLNDKRYGTNTPQEEPTAEQRFNDGLVERNGVTYRQNERTGRWEDVELDQKKLDAEMQLEKEKLKQKQAEVNQKLQEKKLDMAMKIVESSINAETGVASKSLETAMKEISRYFGETDTQAGGTTLDADAAQVMGDAGIMPPVAGQAQAPAITGAIPDPNRSETGALKHIGVTSPMDDLYDGIIKSNPNFNQNQNDYSSAYVQFINAAQKAGMKREEAKAYWLNKNEEALMAESAGQMPQDISGQSINTQQPDANSTSKPAAVKGLSPEQAKGLGQAFVDDVANLYKRDAKGNKIPLSDKDKQASQMQFILSASKMGIDKQAAVDFYNKVVPMAYGEYKPKEAVKYIDSFDKLDFENEDHVKIAKSGYDNYVSEQTRLGTKNILSWEDWVDAMSKNPDAFKQYNKQFNPETYKRGTLSSLARALSN